MTVDCTNCSKCDLDPEWEVEVCDGCETRFFCIDCADEERRYPPFHLHCGDCAMNYQEAMADMEDIEHETIGYREGGYDPYDNSYDDD